MGYTLLDFAFDVLKTSTKPLTYQEIWNDGLKAGLTAKVEATGKTPWQSLGSRLNVEVRDSEKSRFIKVGVRPTRFFLRERQGELPPDAAVEIEREEVKPPESKSDYHERDLHPLLTYFAFADPLFNRDRPIYTKTIFHEKSTKSGYNEWVYPDMVGFNFPIGDWHQEIIDFNRLSDNNALRLYSFEIKKYLNKSNYREAYFQAVSNSLWANESYLVATDILQDDGLLDELKRLSTSFGVGIINLDLADFDNSSVLYPAKSRDSLDWESINKLFKQNNDFERFIQDVRIDFESKRVHRSEYDLVVKDIGQYITTKLKVSTVTSK